MHSLVHSLVEIAFASDVAAIPRCAILGGVNESNFPNSFHGGHACVVHRVIGPRNGDSVRSYSSFAEAVQPFGEAAGISAQVWWQAVFKPCAAVCIGVNHGRVIVMASIISLGVMAQA